MSSARTGAEPQKDGHRSRPRCAAPRAAAAIYSEGEKDDPVVGMGDHTPSFLLRPVKVKPASVPEEQDLKQD